MTDDESLAVTGALYDGILSPHGWRSALEKLAQYTSSEAASLMLWDANLDQMMVGDQVGLPDELLHDYAVHYHVLDTGREFIDRKAIGEWYLDERDLGRGRIQSSPFYQDFLRRYELDSTMATPFMRAANGTHGFLSLSSWGRKKRHA